MGVSTYYEIVPESLLTYLKENKNVCDVFESMWCNGNGMYSWFQEIDEDEIEEITEGHQKQDIEQLKKTLDSATKFESAYIEKTHDILEEIIYRHFEEQKVNNARDLAKIIIYGEESWSDDNYFWLIPDSRLKELADLLKFINVKASVAAYDLGNRHPVELWREDLEMELNFLINCYSSAAKLNHYVLIGSC